MRCPECGRAFSPEELTSTYVPLWPRIMAWYLVGSVIAVVLVAALACYWWRCLSRAAETGSGP